MVGISVYLQELDLAYLEQAAENGAKYVFTSLHIPEEDYQDVQKRIKELLDICQMHALIVVPDISPATFTKLGLETDDFVGLAKLGIKAVRLDYGYDDVQKVVAIADIFEIVFNASTMNRKYFTELQAAGIQTHRIAVMHNFYPRENTGLSKKSFDEKNALFREAGIRIQAFVCGDAKTRFPLFYGLPTIEAHRQVHPYIASVELATTFCVQDVFIGDSQAKLSTLQAIRMFQEEGVVTLPVYLDAKHAEYYDVKEQTRRDGSDDVIRVLKPRTAGIAPYPLQVREIGAITQDNQMYGRYGGEVQICKKHLAADPRVNVIGFVHPAFILLLPLIPEGATIQFRSLDFFDR